MGKLYSLQQAAERLGITQEFIQKFITRGLIIPVIRDQQTKLTPYSLRRLSRIVDLYEKSYTTDSIEVILND